MVEYILLKDKLHHRFQQSRSGIQVFGGGFGNGKTAACVIKALSLARDYPGSNGLIARSTYPKLNDTIRKEFLKWCDKSWIQSFPMSANASNTCTLTNGTQINFRYIAQQARTAESTTSNLLSATYDWIIVDQIEDPEIVHKDFLDLLGRLRGNTVYRGDDPLMPRTGPRWMMVTCNPTRNWFYTKVIRPLQDYYRIKKVSPDLLCVRDSDTREPVLGPDGKPRLLVELFEGGTHENKHNLAEDYIERLESAYSGQMRDRFIKGEWAAYEGLVYPEFDIVQHGISEPNLRRYLQKVVDDGYDLTVTEAYDYGLAEPSCYLLSVTDHRSNVFVVDGFYKSEYPIGDQVRHIRDLRDKWSFGFGDYRPILADPTIFRRSAANARNGGVVGNSVADLFREVSREVRFERGNNDIINGITKVQSYVAFRYDHTHPITLQRPAPTIYFNLDLTFIFDEIGAYFWDQNKSGERIDEPNARTPDHAMDAIKYLLSYKPHAAQLIPTLTKAPPAYMLWSEREAQYYGN